MLIKLVRFHLFFVGGGGWVVNLQGLPDGSLQLLAETGCPKTPVPSSDVAGLYVAVHDDPFKLIQVRLLY